MPGRLSDPVDAAVDQTLKVLREQRDDRQDQYVYGNYSVDPQIFAKRPHFIAGPIVFSTPFAQSPVITFGQYAEQASENVPVNTFDVTGYTPLIIHPYVYSFVHVTGSVGSFYLGLYALTPVPASLTRYTIAWHARGKGSPYSLQRTDEAWTSAYDRNEPSYLTKETGVVDDQSAIDT